MKIILTKLSSLVKGSQNYEETAPSEIRARVLLILGLMLNHSSYRHFKCLLNPLLIISRFVGLEDETLIEKLLAVEDLLKENMERLE